MNEKLMAFPAPPTPTPVSHASPAAPPTPTPQFPVAPPTPTPASTALLLLLLLRLLLLIFLLLLRLLHLLLLLLLLLLRLLLLLLFLLLLLRLLLLLLLLYAGPSLCCPRELADEGPMKSGHFTTLIISQTVKINNISEANFSFVNKNRLLGSRLLHCCDQTPASKWLLGALPALFLCFVNTRLSLGSDHLGSTWMIIQVVIVL